MKPGEERFVRAGQPLRPEILVVDPKGAPVAQVPVRVELIERTWKREPPAGGQVRGRGELRASDRVAATSGP